MLSFLKEDVVFQPMEQKTMKKHLFFILAALVTTATIYAQTTALQFIKELEGSVVLNGWHIAYDDANNKTRWDGVETYEQFIKRCKGTPTIGYGETNKDVVRKLSISQIEADALLNNRIVRIRQYVNSKVRTNINCCQREALVSFVYNVGHGAFAESTMLKHLNNGEFELAGREFARWKYGRVNGKSVVIDGLVKRRAREYKLFNSRD